MSEIIQPTIERDRPGLSGEQRMYRFENGYGASVVRGFGTYGNEAGLWEMAVIRYVGDGVGDDAWHIDYDTPITDDVIGHLDENDVQEKLRAIRDLPAVA